MVGSDSPKTPIILVTDLDGTYFDKGGQIPEPAEELAAVLKSREIEFIVATSRSPNSVPVLLRHLASPYYAICSDGATTIEVDQTKWGVIAEENLDSALGLDIAEFMSDCKLPSEVFLFAPARLEFAICHLCTDTRADSLNILTETLGETRPVRSHMVLDQVRSLLSDGGIRAVSWFAAHAEIEGGKNQLVDVLRDDAIQCLVYREDRYPSYSWLDIISASSAKGEALKKLLESRTARPRIVALGNGDNDVSLFQVADISLCPRDASIRAKAAATRILDASGGSEFVRLVTSLLRSDTSLYGGVK